MKEKSEAGIYLPPKPYEKRPDFDVNNSIKGVSKKITAFLPNNTPS